MPILPQEREVRSVSHLLGYEGAQREAPLPLALRPNIYFCKPTDLSLSFHPREPKGSFLSLFFFFNSLKEIWSSGITPPPLVFDRPRPPLPHMPQDTAGEEGGWLLGRGGDVTSTCHLVSSLTSPSPRQPHPPSLPGGLTWPSHPHAPLPEQARPSRPSLLPPSNGRGAGLAEQAAAA